MKTPVKIAFVTVLVAQTLAVDPDAAASATPASRWRRRSGACLNAGAAVLVPAAAAASTRRSPGWLLFVARLVVALFVLGRAAAGDRRARRRSGCEATLWAQVVRLALRLRRRRCRLLRGAVAAGLPARATSTARDATRDLPRRPPVPAQRLTRWRRLHASRCAALAVRAVRLDALGVEVERVLADLEAALAGDLRLPLLDLRVVELLDAAALHADEVVVVLCPRSARTPPCPTRSGGGRAAPPARTA